eukprot:7373447-Prymnesium_polylepis.1
MQRVSRASEQGRQWADRAQSSRQRSGLHSGRWVEAAHLFRPKLAPNLKMLSSARHRAGRFDVGTVDTARGFLDFARTGHRPTAERSFVQRHGVEECTNFRDLSQLTLCSGYPAFQPWMAARKIQQIGLNPPYRRRRRQHGPRHSAL